MLFMKGTPQSPQCGFSRTACEILVREKVDFGSYDVLSDEPLRQALKAYSSWPTYPQLYAHGELIGGVDIMQQLCSDGALRDALGVEE